VEIKGLAYEAQKKLKGSAFVGWIKPSVKIHSIQNGSKYDNPLHVIFNVHFL